MSATQDLLQHFLHVLALSSSNPQIYLRLTGTLHELIDQATSLPEDNRAAVSKQFNDNVSLLTDGIGELEGLISQNESDAPLPEDDFDDGWDELGMGSSGSDKMSPDELAVTKKVDIFAVFFCISYTMSTGLSCSAIDLDTGRSGQ